MTGQSTTKSEAFDQMVNGAVVKPGGHADPEAMPGRLFSITTISRGVAYGGKRTVMICDAFDKARRAIEGSNGAYWWEYSYMLAVIETVDVNQPHGDMGEREQWWYRYTWDKGAPPGEYPNAHYEAIETPEQMRNTFGFGIG